jgi:hypothetical protein
MSTAAAPPPGAPPAPPPPPPPGPGVTPPFAAPPLEGRTARIWIGLGVAGLALLLCCGGGAAAIVGLMVTTTRALNEQAQTVVGDYLDAVGEGKYARAYQLLCDKAQRDESQDQFAERVSREPDIVSYRLHDLQITGPTLPVDVRYANGTEDTVRFLLAQDRKTGEFEVCGVAG